jgi:Na+-translocating ferredoxin:NAD+ oxidoreductase subunit E
VSAIEKNSIPDASFTAMILALGPALAVSAIVVNAVILAVAVVVTVVSARFILSASEKLIPSHLSVPAYLIIVASLITIIDLLVAAYIPRVSAGLGFYLPIAVVSCLILDHRWVTQRTSAGVGEGVHRSAVFAAWLICISVIREMIGLGTITLFPVGAFDGTLSVGWFSYRPVRLIALAPGAFLVVGYLLAIRNRRMILSASQDAELHAESAASRQSSQRGSAR